MVTRTLPKHFVESYCERCNCLIDYCMNYSESDKYVVLCKDYIFHCHVMTENKERVLTELKENELKG